MRFIKCENKHFYDADKYDDCPRCEKTAEGVEVDSEYDNNLEEASDLEQTIHEKSTVAIELIEQIEIIASSDESNEVSAPAITNQHTPVQSKSITPTNDGVQNQDIQLMSSSNKQGVVSDDEDTDYVFNKGLENTDYVFDKGLYDIKDRENLPDKDLDDNNNKGKNKGKPTKFSFEDFPKKHLTPYLIRRKNNERIPIDKKIFRLGRDQESVDYAIVQNKFISHNHCRIITKDDEYFIVDDNSKNRTFIDGVAIKSYIKIKISHGQIIKLADEEFEFKLY